MKQDVDLDLAFDHLDSVIKKGVRKRQSTVANIQPDAFEEVPRVTLTQEMLVDAEDKPQPLSLEHLKLDDAQAEELVALVYADINTRIEQIIPEWIDEAIQQRVLEMTSKAHQERSPSTD